MILGALKLWQRYTCLSVAMCVPRQNVHLSCAKMIKEIHESQEGNVRIFQGVNILSPREPYLVKTDDSRGCCTICSLGLDVKHTDVLILSQFLRSDGCMLPRRVTGLCRNQQKRMSKMVAMAQKAGLMPNIAPPKSKMDPKRRYKWKKYNTYFDESTIKDVRSITSGKKGASTQM
ncbi:39S ribosomal protein S18a, mitochondrial [Zootermopsis nevadensis]|uniref:Large ribosomal subunit protein mL66 n=1 Tax=Zootermopsis nevadensis TaxID=136037 RepID=A0A067RWB2_ZOONE|nr:39S ribosomal protein S18a, mitochondrial [Zootermopsis nevadensis]KDR24159.1 28S ribosomal protein S18a, mitochondrial [Zootermopsis nevadensis]